MSRSRPPKYLVEATLADVPPLSPNADRFDRVRYIAMIILPHQDEGLWTDCPDVERDPGTLGGQWRVKGNPRSGAGDH